MIRREKYKFFAGVKINLSKIEKNIPLLKKRKIDYEFRTTVSPGLQKGDIFKIADWIKPAQVYFLQKMNLQKEIIDLRIKILPCVSREEIEKIVKEIKSKFKICELR